MKVWVAMYYDYSNTDAEGVYSSPQKAQEAIGGKLKDLGNDEWGLRSVILRPFELDVRP